MVEYIQSDIFDAPIDVLVHSCNCMGIMGSGIAAQVKSLYPEAYEKDCKTKPSDPAKLGTYTSVKTTSRPDYRPSYIVNLYGQFQISGTKKETSYDAIDSGLRLLKNNMEKKGLQNMVIGIPWKLGSNRGGGSWRVVEAIIRDIFEDGNFRVLICQRPEDM